MTVRYSDAFPHIVVNYHYVQPSSPEKAGIHPCEPDEFDRQIAYLSSSYAVGTLADVVRAAREHSTQRIAAITFDDGMRDNYTIAAPILETHGVRALFLPIGSALSGRIPFTHQVHILLSCATPHEIAHAIDEIRTSLDIPELPLDAPLNPARRFGDFQTANVKEYMIRMPASQRAVLMDTLFETFKIDRSAWYQDLFMSPDEIRDLHARGHRIGNHSFDHEACDGNADWLADVERAQGFLENILGVRPDTLAYPYGRVPRDLETHRSSLAAAGILYGVTTEVCDVHADTDPYRTPRFDCNDIRDHLRTIS